ncbi:DsbC family protein [Denitratisoma oestradiolicum]|uniref:Thiol:disulfide interchange protein n=1 Tax=Denitratisoma oestradiolicum TaxID=311182 RepID=A0A6S6Y976_9PROT|nr:DsbC family protein [Denitratisoma oestradiolicum]TWO82156.1 disulfide isomerase [Denitratisoma oestradiolicum]CAB1369090.1 Thiol:disulfide interchange protein [Denitratisoma oestradiolicum]
MQFNQPRFKRLPMLFAWMLSMAAQADDGVGSLEKRLKDMYPATRIERVQASEIPTLFEVTMGKNSAYTDATGRYFVFGHLYDMKTQRDLTAERMEKQQRIDFAQLPLPDAIKTVRGKGERVLAVFSDPDCPYCKRLEAELDKLNNVTLYTFPYPLEGLHPEAVDKSVAVWCAPDRARAWADLIRTGKTPAKRKCDNPIERNIQLAQRLGIQGTPTLLSADGRMLPGAAPSERIEQWLAESRP